jgi:plastocyanin
MRRPALILLRLGAGIALLFGAAQALGSNPASAATAVTINGAAACSGATFCFAPATVNVPSGDTVTWTNQSGAAHTVTRCDPAACSATDGGTGTDPAFDLSVASANGSTANQTFNGAGTYNYYCKIHGFAVMHGTITVQAQAGPTTTVGPSATTTTAPAAAAAAGTTTTTPPASAPAPAVSGQVNFTG